MIFKFLVAYCSETLFNKFLGFGGVFINNPFVPLLVNVEVQHDPAGWIHILQNMQNDDFGIVLDGRVHSITQGIDCIGRKIGCIKNFLDFRNHCIILSGMFSSRSFVGTPGNCLTPDKKPLLPALHSDNFLPVMFPGIR